VCAGLCACVFVCLCACVLVCLCACVLVCLCACVLVCLCACVLVCLCACVLVCVCAGVLVCALTRRPDMVGVGCCPHRRPCAFVFLRVFLVACVCGCPGAHCAHLLERTVHRQRAGHGAGEGRRRHSGHPNGCPGGSTLPGVRPYERVLGACVRARVRVHVGLRRALVSRPPPLVTEL
jgi:hypothetical protein